MQKILTLIICLLCTLTTSIHASTFTIQSTSFNDIDTINTIYSCHGKNISPELDWNHPPTKTTSFALILSDPDAPNGTFYHWVLFNIPKSVTSLPENISTLPSGTQVGNNSSGKAQYTGPCPPKGSKHHYVVSLYALDTTLNLPNGADASAIFDAMQNHILDIAELKSVYGNE